MVLISEQRERSPPGGGGFSGYFQKKPFNAAIFPKGVRLERDGTQRLELSEHKSLCMQPDMMHAAEIAFAIEREFIKPSRLRVACGDQLRRVEPGSQRLAPLRGSASSPALRGLPENPLEAGAAARGAEYGGLPASQGLSLGTPGRSPQATLGRPASHGGLGTPLGSARRSESEWAEEEDFPQMAATSRWYPHVSANRGALKLTGPAAMIRGIDPQQDKGHECPFWSADRHRFAELAAQPDTRPRTPTKSMRWRSDAAWNDPTMHGTWKVTQTFR